ncbi:proline-rich protein 15-like protein [Onychostruthus taczanowskii]|uniref:proline-rich protein 15-like protein n=2 Tax=Passeridae TaxID=9158 RepID=UPI001B80063E|nr:proline-rich protein 15-like protein [Onychostruthus taczanowskii]
MSMGTFRQSPAPAPAPRPIKARSAQRSRSRQSELAARRQRHVPVLPLDEGERAWSVRTNRMADGHGWWKLTFLRKRQAAPTVLYESPEGPAAPGGDGAEGTGPEGTPGFAARLEKIVDKSTKGKHVKVSHSGRFKEKKKVRATLAEHPNLCGAGEREEQ